MSYNPTTDFIGLLRQTGGGVRTERMPGLDYVAAALARLGLAAVSVGPVAPSVNQATTVWFRPSVPSWVAEGTAFLWNALTVAYEPATPALWKAFFGAALAPSGYVFQALPSAVNIIAANVSLAAIERVTPASTLLTLPSLAAQSGKTIQVVDWSSGVTNHTIFISTPDGATIMKQNTWELLSTADQLASVSLTPSIDLNAWVIT